MNILILGSGGREHTFAWKIAKSSRCNKLYVAPGNSGTVEIAENINLKVTDFEAIRAVVLSHCINMVVVGPEDPLVQGIHDYFLNHEELNGIAVIGPQKAAAELEGSKEFAKEFMMRHNIPTAAYKSFTKDNVVEGYKFLETLNSPYVLKADGLAAGKGVIIAFNHQEALASFEEMIQHKQFGAASSKVVIEQFLEGIEVSVFALTDGKNYQIIGHAKDYKRIGEGDTGLNTGGMGCVSPVPFMDEAFMHKVIQRVVEPTINGFQKESLEYKGFVFFGLMNCGGEPFVIEYNVRMGDPETEVVFPRIQNDWVELFQAVGTQTLDQYQLQIDPRTATTIMVVSGGYPEAYEKGKTITGIESAEDSVVFHAGTQMKLGVVKTSGGRVLAVTSFGPDHKKALSKSYETLEKIDFDGMYYRKDLGFDL